MFSAIGKTGHLIRFRISVYRNTGLNILSSNRYMFRSYDHLQALEDSHKTETCSGYWIKYSNQCCVRRKP
jgi:hypothetical protein